ncbi:IclR family transcriptional regulator [Streptomyces sp. XD-27]|uniref:IclR family transcriptional regulator n=1 Tax=Streptomyces sp. XD-27 TaxID=3062779 RepID=UPI0026F4210F|nr:helix-turn-helix domain-containing protein [Streptomyces sp. XD-27]WKX71541.1 helix-turn-helix domain-containing protein [Streptomyces sp. XD-27]
MATEKAGAVSEPTLITSVQRALHLLEAVGRHPGGAPAKQLARAAGLPLPTAYHLLRTLTYEGYLSREGGVFVLGEAVERLGGAGARARQRAEVGAALARLGDEVGVAVYFSVYREGEVEVVAIADRPESPAVEEWADFRSTAHAHAIGQCLLAQLDERDREDHLSRYPVQALTPYSVRNASDLRRRLAARDRSQPVIERQEYVLGTVCGAFPVAAGDTAASLAISVPVGEAERLRPAMESLRSRVPHAISSLSFSISI